MHQITRGLIFSVLCLTLAACSENDSSNNILDDDLPSGDDPALIDDDAGTTPDSDEATLDDDDDGDDTDAADDGDDADATDGGDGTEDDVVIGDVVIIDTDSDGLSDEEEVVLGLDPSNADSDGDGTNDGEDEFPNASSIADSDGDLLTDQDEELLGLDPTNPDSDGDGVDDGNDPFPNASSILDTDGDSITDEDEISLGTDPTNSDSDGDGLSDSEDPFPSNPDPDGAVTNPDIADDGTDDGTDGDGDAGTDDDAVTDGGADTDGDGVSDADEVALGSDPTTADTDSDGVNDSDDPFPNDSTASLDSDGDGVDDGRDEFPNDPAETSDLNGDGLGDNANPFEGTVISGVVVDSGSQAPVADVPVSLDVINTGAGTNPVVLTTTDTDGAFNIVVADGLLPDSFAVVTSLDGFTPVATPLENSGDAINVENIGLEAIPDSFITVESAPTVHHLGDDDFVGAANSQFQRTTEGASFQRNFNVSEALASAETLELIWIAKGIQIANTISVNGTEVATASNTSDDGSFDEQTISLDVSGILNAGSNTLTIESVPDDTGNLDDFEFVLIGLQGL